MQRYRMETDGGGSSYTPIHDDDGLWVGALEADDRIAELELAADKLMVRVGNAEARLRRCAESCSQASRNSIYEHFGCFPDYINPMEASERVRARELGGQG